MDVCNHQKKKSQSTKVRSVTRLFLQKKKAPEMHILENIQEKLPLRAPNLNSTLNDFITAMWRENISAHKSMDYLSYLQLHYVCLWILMKIATLLTCFLLPRLTPKALSIEPWYRHWSWPSERDKAQPESMMSWRVESLFRWWKALLASFHV